MRNTSTYAPEPAERPNVPGRTRRVGPGGSLGMLSVLAVVVLAIVGGLGLLGALGTSAVAPTPSNGNAPLHTLQYGTYNVTFSESGLPTGTYWGVSDGSYTQYASSPSIVFFEPNGTLDYSIVPLAGYTTSWTGNLTINGLNVTVPITFDPFTYAVSFIETGLPTRTTWGISCNGAAETTNTIELTFFEPNGTSNWTVSPIAGYTSTNATGALLVNAANSTINVTFTPALSYAIGFNESGLPTGTDWTVTLGSASATSNASSIGFTETNGSYRWTITPIAGYTTTWSGSVTVSGANVTVSVVFSQAAYALRFSESGLPKGTQWTVTIGGSSTSSTSASVGFTEPNGTYRWAITPIAGYSTTWNGTTTVAGAGVAITVDFSEFTYAVTFSETGLAASTSWEVTIASVSESSTTSSIVFSEPNGTFAWTIGSVAGYTTTWSGNGSVDAGPVSVGVRFAVANYSLAFLERGLPAGTSWTVSIGSSSRSSIGSEIAFSVQDGVYAWLVTPVAGYTTNWSGSATVHGADTVIDVNFTQVVYPLAFVETGLPTGTTWSVDVGGATISGHSSTLLTPEPNGTYGYTVLPVPGFSTTGATASVTIAGAGRSIPVPFQAVEYTVTFAETGLPGGTHWSVSLNGAPNASSTPTISFDVANGTYGFVVAPVPGYTTATSGTVVVHGLDQTVSVRFLPFLSVVTFVPVGLPPGTSWGVDLAGRTGTGVGGPIAFSEANGTYSYTISPVPGFATTWSGTVQVEGSAIMVSVAFLPFGYAIGFSETGLAAGVSWTVSIGDQSAGGAGQTLSLIEPNGTYSYTVAPIAGYTADWSGLVTVDGSAPTVSVAFQTMTYAQTFQATGLPAGTNWSVTITASSGSGPGGGGASVTVWSDGASSISYPLANGTYTYRTSAPGFGTVGGSLGVSGAVPAAVTVPMVSTGPAPSAIPLWELATLVGGIAVVVVALALLWMGRRRRKESPAQEDPRVEEPHPTEGSS
jgi:hypothetical protein